LPEHPWPDVPARDDFDAPALAPSWTFLRVPDVSSWSLGERPGFLRLRLRPERISEHSNPSFVGRRQQHIYFWAQTALEFTPQNANECAGIVLQQNDKFNFSFVVTMDEEPIVRLVKRADGQDEILAEQPVSAGRLYLKVTAHEQSYSFYTATNLEKWYPLAEDVDGRILSTPVAGGFVGAWIALYASSNGQPSTNHADFDWFEYLGSE